MNEERDRQLERTREVLEEKAEEARIKAQEGQLDSAERTSDEQSVRAKNTGHGKKTADKWNQ